MDLDLVEKLIAKDEDLAKDEIQMALGVQRLGRMFGLTSINRSMKDEEEAIVQENKDIRDLLHNPCGSEGEAMEKKKDEMRDVTAARDVHFHKEQSKAGKLLTAGLAAIGIGAGAALPIIAWNMSRKDTVAVEPTEPIAQDFSARFVPLPAGEE